MDLVVLGHRLNIDGKIRPILRRRLDHASQLYLPLHAGRIILVGGNPVSGVSEAARMREYLLAEHGFDISRLLTEESSTSTLENALFLRAATKRFGLSEFNVVTSCYHAPSAKRYFSAVFDSEVVVHYPPPTLDDAPKFLLSLPKAVLTAYRVAMYRASEE